MRPVDTVPTGAAPRSDTFVPMPRILGELLPGTKSLVPKRVLWRAGWWLIFVTLFDVGLGLLLGSGMWWLGWKRAPDPDFFATLAGIGGTLLIAYSVTVTQVLPALVRHAIRPETALTTDVFGNMLGFALAVALAAVVGLGTCLALVPDRLGRSQWLGMGLFGVSLFTLAVLALAIGLGTLIYVLLFLHGSPSGDGAPPAF